MLLNKWSQNHMSSLVGLRLVVHFWLSYLLLSEPYVQLSRIKTILVVCMSLSASRSEPYVQLSRIKTHWPLLWILLISFGQNHMSSLVGLRPIFNIVNWDLTTSQNHMSSLVGLRLCLKKLLKIVCRSEPYVQLSRIKTFVGLLSNPKNGGQNHMSSLVGLRHSHCQC